MIDSREALRYYLYEDAKRVGLTNWFRYRILRFYGTETSHALRYLKCLRHLEYYHNCSHGILNKLMLYYYKFKHSRLGLKYNIHIGVNMVGYGFRMPHIAGGIIINCNKMGNYCTANSGVVVGNKFKLDARPTMGDNVDLSIGCKVVGRVVIGSNVIVAPNSVVVKDIPDNCCVSGIPATILKYLP